MKHLNIKLLLILGIGSSVSAIGVHLLHGYQVERNADKLLERADEAERNGDLQSVQEILERYLKYRRNDEGTKVRYYTIVQKRLDEETQNVSLFRELFNTYAGLEGAAREHPDNIELRRLAANFAVRIGRTNDALEHLKVLADAQASTPADTVLMGRCYLARGEDDKGIEILGRLVGFDPASETFADQSGTHPDETMAYWWLARVYQLRRSSGLDLTVPDRIMDRMVEVNPNSYEAYLKRANYRRISRKGNEWIEQALPDYQKAYQLAPDEPRVALQLSEAYILSGRLDDAQSLLDQCKQKYPKNAGVYGLLSALAKRQNNDARALEYIEEGLKQLPKDRTLLTQRASLELETGRLNACRRTLDLLAQEGLVSINYIQLMRARLDMAENKWLEASARLEDLRRRVSANETREVDSYLEKCYAQLGYNDKRLAVIRRLQGSDPENVSTQLDRALALMADGQIEEAIPLLTQMLSEHSKNLTPEGHIVLRHNLLQMLLAQQKRLPVDQRDWTRIDQLATELKQLLPNRFDREHVDVMLLVAQGKDREARQRVEAGIAQNPQVEVYWWLLNEMTNDPGEGLKILDQIAQRFGDSLRLRQARMERYVQQGGAETAEKLAQLEQDTARFSPDELDKLQRSLASAYQRVQQYEKAAELWHRVAEANPSDVRARSTLFELGIESNNPDLMQESLDQLASLEGQNSSTWQMARARQLIWMHQNGKGDSNTLRRARQMIDSARRQRPDWTPLYELESDLAVLEGKLDDSIAALREALNRRPDNDRYIRKLYQRLIFRGRNQEAEAVLSRLSQTQLTSSDVVSMINLWLASNDPQNVQRALEMAESIVSLESTNVDNLLFLARVQETAGKADASLATYRRLTELIPDQPGPWWKLVRLLVATKQPEAARALLDTIRQRVKPEDQPLLLGQCYTALNELDTAKQHYLKALESDPDNTVVLRNLVLLHGGLQQGDQVRKYLEEIIRRADPQNPEDRNNASWARLALAQNLGASGQYQDFLQALAVIEHGQAPTDLSSNELTEWARLCEQRPETTSQQRAIDVLEKVQRNRALTPDQQLILAKLYKRNGRWGEANSLMINLLASYSDNQALLATYIPWLLERNVLREADRWIQKLTQNSGSRIRFEAILKVRQGNPVEAARQLLALVPDNLPAEQADSIRDVAVMLEELGTYDSRFYPLAEKQYRRYASLRPDGNLLLASFLMRLPTPSQFNQEFAAKLTEGFQLCEQVLAQQAQAKQTQRIVELLQAGNDVLRRHRQILPGNSPLYAQVQRWFQLAEQAGVDANAILFARAGFADVHGDTQQLIQLYQQYLSQPDTQPLQRAFVQNNLAYLLALMGQGQQALSVIEGAIQSLQPHNDLWNYLAGELLDTRATAFLVSGQHRKAIDDLQAALKQGGPSAPIYFHLALAEHRNGDDDAAVTALNQARELGLNESQLSELERKLYRELIDQLKPKLAQ